MSEFRSTMLRALEARVRRGAACPECKAPMPSRIRIMCDREVPSDATFMVTITCTNGCSVFPCAVEWHDIDS